MAFQCRTSSGSEWDSKLTSRLTGRVIEDDVKIIEIDEEDPSTGNFLGTHFPTGGLIQGACREGSSTSGHIKFIRRVREGNQTFIFTYEGDFIKDGNRLITQGATFTKKLRGREKERDISRAAGEDEGTWNGEKPIT
jgi:hypothetical protein